MWVCGHCNGENGDNSISCISCGNRKVTKDQYNKLKVRQEEEFNKNILERFTENDREIFVSEQKRKEIELNRSKIEKDFIIITAPILENYRIIEYKTIVTSQVVLGTGVVSEFGASLSDFGGGRCTSFENKMKESKWHAINELKNKAINAGCNAIISADIKEVVFPNNMIAVTACGTPVIIERKVSEI